MVIYIYIMHTAYTYAYSKQLPNTMGPISSASMSQCWSTGQPCPRPHVRTIVSARRSPLATQRRPELIKETYNIQEKSIWGLTWLDAPPPQHPHTQTNECRTSVVFTQCSRTFEYGKGQSRTLEALQRYYNTKWIQNGLPEQLP